MSHPSWRSANAVSRLNPTDRARAEQILKNILYNQPTLQNTLGKYTAELIHCLDTKVQANHISVQQASQEFIRTIQQWQQNVQNSVARQLDQTDLSNPLNMASALSMSGGLASVNMSDTDFTSTATTNLESALKEATASNAALTNNLEEMQQTQQGKHASTMDEAKTGAAVLGVLAGFDGADVKAGFNTLEKMFHDNSSFTKELDKITNPLEKDLEGASYAPKFTPKDIKSKLDE